MKKKKSKFLGAKSSALLWYASTRCGKLHLDEASCSTLPQEPCEPAQRISSAGAKSSAPPVVCVDQIRQAAASFDKLQLDATSGSTG